MWIFMAVIYSIRASQNMEIINYMNHCVTQDLLTTKMLYHHHLTIIYYVINTKGIQYRIHVLDRKVIIVYNNFNFIK